jgi:hypothetical protein
LRSTVNPTGRLDPEKDISLGHKYIALLVITVKYISLGYKHLTPGNRAAEKESSYSAVFEAVKEKLLWLKCNLEVGSQSYREIASRKI